MFKFHCSVFGLTRRFEIVLIPPSGFRSGATALSCPVAFAAPRPVLAPTIVPPTAFGVAAVRGGTETNGHLLNDDCHGEGEDDERQVRPGRLSRKFLGQR